MIKVMLVDDEQPDILMLRQLIDWDALGLKIVGEASDAPGAIALDARCHPDIVITDISMPGASGVQLAAQLRKKRPDVHIICLSGFQDFQAAKDAIASGVERYLLKPVCKSELEQVLKEVSARCIGEAKQRFEQMEFQKLLEENMPLLRELFFQRWVAGELSPAEIESQMAFYGIHLAGSTFAVILVRPEDDSANPGDEYGRKFTQFEVQSAIARASEGREYHRFSTGTQGEHVVIAGCPEGSPAQVRAYLYAYATDIVQSIRLLSSRSATVGVGCPSTDPCEAAHSYKTACLASDQRFFIGNGQAILYSDLPQQKTPVAPRDFANHDKILRLVLSGNLDELEAVYSEITSNILASGATMEVTRSLFIEIVSNVLVNASNIAGNVEAIPSSDSEVYRRLIEAGTLEELSAEGKNVLCGICASVAAFNSNRHHNIVKAIYDIVEQRMPQELSVDIIADEVYLSRGYVSRIFKQLTGESINRYIANARIQKAKQLLLSAPGEKVQNIALAVGFNNTSYFISVFKNETGMTPREFRELQGASERR